MCSNYHGKHGTTAVRAKVLDTRIVSRVSACFEQCCDWTRKAGSQCVTAVTAEFTEVDDY